jgi:hypothetical protein
MECGGRGMFGGLNQTVIFVTIRTRRESGVAGAGPSGSGLVRRGAMRDSEKKADQRLTMRAGQGMIKGCR